MSDKEHELSDELRQRRYFAFGGQRDEIFDRVDEFARVHSLENDYTPRIPHIETLRELVAAGAGYALVPSYTARLECERGRLVTRHVAGLRGEFPVLMVRRSQGLVTPALEAFCTSLAELRA